MKLAYGTYAMPVTPLEEAFGQLQAIGFEGVELCVSPKHVGSLPGEMDKARRAELRARLNDLGLTVVAFMPMVSLWTPDDEQHAKRLDYLAELSELARDLGVREPPVFGIGIGGKRDEWDTIRGKLAERLGDYGERAAALDVIVAGEAHCGAAVDRSERAMALLDEVAHPRVRLHFDIVHFHLAGEDTAEVTAKLLPYTGHTHITDCRRHPDGKFDLLLLGDGEVDSVAFAKAMYEGGWNDFLTLEVSTRVWSQPEYDAHAAAVQSYRELDGACRTAGVPRG